MRNLVLDNNRRIAFQRKCVLLEPDALEQFQAGDFTYNIAAGALRCVVASYLMRYAGLGLTDVRDPSQPLWVSGGASGIALTGVDPAHQASAIILDPTKAKYSDPESLYEARMQYLDSISFRHLNINNTSTSAIVDTDFLPGPYGAIIRHANNQSLVWVILRYGNDSGINLANEVGDANTQTQNNTNALWMPVNKWTCSQFTVGETRTGSPPLPLGTLSYQLLPRSWSMVPDPISSSYTFRDDFMAAALDTTTNWNAPTTGGGGSIAINTDFQWLKFKGDASWGTNGLISKVSSARSSEPTIVFDICPAVAGNGASACTTIGGFHDGAGVSYTDLAHGVIMTSYGNGASAGTIGIYENGNSRGTMKTTCKSGTVYRVKIKALAGGGATYSIQGGTLAENLGAIGSANWTDITPGTTTSPTNTLYPGFSIQGATNSYVSDVRVY